MTMSGHLRGRDLRRLERLCGPALEYESPPLTLRMKSNTTTDDAARAFLDHLIDRGALLLFD